MKTLKVDARKRIRLAEAKPEQVFICENEGKGRFILTLVKSDAGEPFPPGSLVKYISRAKNTEQLTLLKGSTLETE